MTDPKAKAMSVEEAVDCLRQNAPWIEEADTPQMILERDTHLAALATLEALAEENVRLKAELADQKKALDLCGYIIEPIRNERDALKEEVERFKNFALVANDNENIWKDRAEKAEAELDAARPLLEAAKYLREEVLAFAGRMETELRKHDDRPGWKGCDPQWLLSRLRDEAEELGAALLDHSESVGREAADVANFSMMIADVEGALAYRASREGKK